MLGLSLVVSSQGGAAEAPLSWRWSNPLPHGNNIYDMAFQDGVYWQVADQGRIYRSTDRTTWTPVDSGTTAALRGIASHGGEVLICGESGLLLSGTSAQGFRPQPLLPPTTDWLEAVAASDQAAVAVGDAAAIYRRGTGSEWSRVSGHSFTNWLRGVAYGDGTFVAVGEDGFIATSPDGQTWARQNSPVASALNRVTFVNDAFYACGNAGVLLCGQSGGTQWELVDVGATEDLYAYAAQPAIPDSVRSPELAAGDLVLQMRDDPNSPWLDHLGSGSLFPAPTWSYYATIWDGQRFLVAGRSGMLVESFWTDDPDIGTLWFEASDSPRDWLWDVIGLPNQYIAVGDRATIMTSQNGVDWSRENVPSNFTDPVILGVGGSSNLVVAAGSNGTLMFSPSSITNILATNVLVTLNDCEWETNSVVVTNEVDLLGLVWHAVQPAPTSFTLQGVTERDRLIVVVGDNGTVLTTTTGSTWTSRTIPGAPNLSSVAASPDRFVATGDDGALYCSHDTLEWERRDLGTTEWIYRVRYLGGRFVAVGQNGLIIFSSNGLEWDSASSRTTSWLTDVGFTGGFYFVCGTQGSLLVSTDLTDWTATETITGKSLYSLAIRDGQLIVVGVEGVILRSLLAGLAPPNISDFSHVQCPAFTYDRLQLLGRPDQSVVIERSLDLRTWDPVGRLAFLDTEATFDLLRTNTVPAQAEFFRAVPLAP